MSRPSGGTDRQLVEAGRRLIGKSGLSGLSIRQVATEAGVNLGLFHYHFKTKEQFGQAILQEIYEEFFKKFSLESAKEGKPLERLRRSLIILGHFIRDVRELALALIQDVMEGYAPTIHFLQKNFFRHVSILLAQVKACQSSGEIPRLPIPLVISFLMAGVGLPSLVTGVMRRAGAKTPLGIPLKIVESIILSDEAIEMRVEMAIHGLKTGGRRR